MEKLKPLAIALAAIGLAWAAVTALFPASNVQRSTPEVPAALTAKKASLQAPKGIEPVAARRSPSEILADDEASDTAVERAELRAGPEGTRRVVQPSLQAPDPDMVPLEPIRAPGEALDAQ